MDENPYQPPPIPSDRPRGLRIDWAGIGNALLALVIIFFAAGGVLRPLFWLLKKM